MIVVKLIDLPCGTVRYCQSPGLANIYVCVRGVELILRFFVVVVFVCIFEKSTYTFLGSTSWRAWDPAHSFRLNNRVAG